MHLLPRALLCRLTATVDAGLYDVINDVYGDKTFTGKSQNRLSLFMCSPFCILGRLYMYHLSAHLGSLLMYHLSAHLGSLFMYHLSAHLGSLLMCHLCAYLGVY